MTKVQRYKVGYYSDEWGMSSNTPCLIPDDSGYAVKFEDYCKLETELAVLKAELREICAAIDDPASDLTLTTVECIKKLKAENETAWAQAHRLALELECLLLDTKDNAVVSKWWDSGMAALDEYQRLKPGAKDEAEAWAKMRKSNGHQ